MTSIILRSGALKHCLIEVNRVFLIVSLCHSICLYMILNLFYIFGLLPRSEFLIHFCTKRYMNFFVVIYTFGFSWTSIKGLIVTCFSFAVLFSSSSRPLICVILVFTLLSLLPLYIRFCLSHSHFICHVCCNFRSQFYVSLSGCWHSFRRPCYPRRRPWSFLTCGCAKHSNIA